MNKSTLVPRLRFPAFQGAWDFSSMSQIYSFKGNNSLSRDKLNYSQGSFRNIHYGDIHTKFSLHFRVDREIVPYINDGELHSSIRPENYCVAGDIVFADASEDIEDIGKVIEIIDAGDIPLVSGLHTILARPCEEILSLGFGAYLFSSEGVRRQIQREAQGAKVLGLSASRLGNVQLYYPSKIEEQQKIADCLSSIDELISAEARKLDALKAHKKGLMQQLFPAEGETIPRLRFPEFRDAGEWKKKKISDVLMEAVRPLEMEDDEEYSLVIVKRRYEGIVSRGKLQGKSIKVKSQFFLQKDDFLISKRQIVHCACGLVPDEFDGAIVSNEYSVLRAKNGFCIKFFKYFCQQPMVGRSFLECSIGVVIEKMLFKINDWLKREFLFPSLDEQVRIANHFSSIEELIAAQDQMVNALKTHKHGLMQQLFPVMDEMQT